MTRDFLVGTTGKPDQSVCLGMGFTGVGAYVFISGGSMHRLDADERLTMKCPAMPTSHGGRGSAAVCYSSDPSGYDCLHSSSYS